MRRIPTRELGCGGAKEGDGIAWQISSCCGESETGCCQVRSTPGEGVRASGATRIQRFQRRCLAAGMAGAEGTVGAADVPATRNVERGASDNLGAALIVREERVRLLCPEFRCRFRRPAASQTLQHRVGSKQRPNRGLGLEFGFRAAAVGAAGTPASAG